MKGSISFQTFDHCHFLGMKNQTWKEANPNQTSERCYYVGQSSHTPECRRKQHVTKRGESCTCCCDKKHGQEVNEYVVGRGQFVKDHAREVCPELYEDLNPFDTQAEAEEAEEG